MRANTSAGVKFFVLPIEERKTSTAEARSARRDCDAAAAATRQSDANRFCDEGAVPAATELDPAWNPTRLIRIFRTIQ